MINPRSKLAQIFWEQGFADDCPIIDVHAHMNGFYGNYLPEESTDKIYGRMLKCNTRLMLFCGHHAIFHPASRHAYDITAVRKYPDRMRAYFGISGCSADLEADFRRFVDNPDVFVGIKLLPGYSGYGLNDDIYKPFFEHCNLHKMPVLCHTWGAGPGSKAGIGEEKFVQKYPDIMFFAGHSFHGSWDDAVRLCNTYDNLYLELTAVIDEVGPLELFLDKCGSQKLLFGTDLPWFDTLHGIGYILSTPMSDEDRKNIFFRNAVRLLGHHEWFNKLWNNPE